MRKYQVLSVLALLLLVAVARADWPRSCDLEAYVLNFEHKAKIHIVSNVPKADLVTPLLRQYAARQGWDYVPLDTVGKSGKNGDELLPYEPFSLADKTVLVVDEGTLTTDQRERLEPLRELLFPQAEAIGGQKITVLFHRTGPVAYHAFVRFPRLVWLRKAMEEAWGVPYTRKLLESCPSEELINIDVCRAVVLTNERSIGGSVLKNLGIKSKVDVFGLDQLDQFLAAADADAKISVLNWNAETEVPRATALQALPEGERQGLEVEELSPTWLTPWQQYCRKVVVTRWKAPTGETQWLVAAPTSRHLETAQRALKGVELEPLDTTELQPPDMTIYRRFALGVLLKDPDLDPKNRSNIVLQQQLEQVAATRLGMRTSAPLSTSQWEDLLKLIGSSESGPLKTADDAKKIVATTNADLMLVLVAQHLEPAIRQQMGTPRRVTDPLPSPGPEPKAPDPNERIQSAGNNGNVLLEILRPFKYPGKTEEDRKNSEAFRRDDEAYRRRLDEWREKQREYEAACRTRKVDWVFPVSEVNEAALQGYLWAVDLVTGKIVWSRSLDVKAQGSERPLSAKTVPVTGESTNPTPPTAPDAERKWESGTFVAGNKTLELALKQALDELLQKALWPSDLKPWNEAKRPLEDPPAGGMIVRTTDKKALVGAIAEDCGWQVGTMLCALVGDKTVEAKVVSIEPGGNNARDNWRHATCALVEPVPEGLGPKELDESMAFRTRPAAPAGKAMARWACANGFLVALGEGCETKPDSTLAIAARPAEAVLTVTSVLGEQSGEVRVLCKTLEGIAPPEPGTVLVCNGKKTPPDQSIVTAINRDGTATVELGEDLRPDAGARLSVQGFEKTPALEVVKVEGSVAHCRVLDPANAPIEGSVMVLTETIPPADWTVADASAYPKVVLGPAPAGLTHCKPGMLVAVIVEQRRGNTSRQVAGGLLKIQSLGEQTTAQASSEFCKSDDVAAGDRVAVAFLAQGSGKDKATALSKARNALGAQLKSAGLSADAVAVIMKGAQERKTAASGKSVVVSLVAMVTSWPQ